MMKMPSLVLDLDQTLVSMFDLPPKGDFKKVLINRRFIYLKFRPGLFEFLCSVSHVFELFVFTSTPQVIANPIIDLICDSCMIPKIPKDNRFFREDCFIENGYYVKDLSLVRKDTHNVILIDDTPGSSQKQAKCLMRIKPWFGANEGDNELLGTILPLLQRFLLSIEENGEHENGIYEFEHLASYVSSDTMLRLPVCVSNTI